MRWWSYTGENDIFITMVPPSPPDVGLLAVCNSHQRNNHFHPSLKAIMGLATPVTLLSILTGVLAVGNYTFSSQQCSSTSLLPPITVTRGSDASYTQTYLTVYDELCTCAKGKQPHTYTITETCDSVLCRSPMETGLPPGFTSAVVACDNCVVGTTITQTITCPSASLKAFPSSGYRILAAPTGNAAPDGGAASGNAAAPGAATPGNDEYPGRAGAPGGAVGSGGGAGPSGVPITGVSATMPRPTHLALAAVIMSTIWTYRLNT